ncbi:MAG: hypothetical protein A2358_03015 [Candidatus Staskawiczbacteria bacterium RIFOXYB1_FULL_37_44]|uniref:Uncharacterized protein n=1 Tax=Candidatus Staskawiczbacteria bacterium RIFOXYB1_FULL_37_44 TaxID=1802223 RepID=A0A1G2IV68_9BACT|nr:MAG: hypothetical protein A2358_03015 [Candidatus Staskawiczbacteria bacterium RIFOXYB1_FULL_37_44]OGZ83894.1 MAG: hypothetical protein A2416_02730 [Candidatus Staskawiczbacteria bacterium RIFOXYC1_FULL_37_52]OGZ87087.1 MAG: hypothetical protein A2444_01705 [Candidatus Staskawiczbacteria bacterium RIFOXYC2_FULL_37_19]
MQDGTSDSLTSMSFDKLSFRYVFFSLIVACALVPVIATGVALYLWGDQQTPAEKEEVEKTANVYAFTEAIRYAKDPRTGLCFAYVTSGFSTSMVLVPEEKIPCELLGVAKPRVD